MMSTIDAAITAHLLWRMRMTNALMSGNLEGIDRDMAARDDACALGQWISGPGTALQDEAVFQEFVECHRLFHASLAPIIRKIDGGDMAGAKREMFSGEFAFYSQALVDHISKLEDLIAPGGKRTERR